MQEVLFAIILYCITVVFGLVGFIFLKLFVKREDLNPFLYAISKPIGIIVLGYPVWLASSLRLLNFNPNTSVRIIFIFVVIGIFALFVLKYRIFTIRKIKDFLVTRKKLILKMISIDLASLAFYFLYLYVRSFSPDIVHTEAPMDLLLLSSAGKTDYFPFFDPWLVNENINYYYYGFYLLALLLKIGDIPYEIGYNLSLSFIFFQTFVGAFCISYFLTKKIFGALISGLLVLFAGNLHYVNCLLDNVAKGTDLVNVCYYPKATRIYDPAYTINEITSYSFVLGDLHPHLISVPFFLSSLFLIFVWFRYSSVAKNLNLPIIISTSSTALINFWDFITIGLIYGFLWLVVIAKGFKKNQFRLKNFYTDFLLRNKNLFIYPFVIAFSPFVFFWPFFMHFKSPVAGIGYIPEYIDIMKENGVQIEQYPSTFGFLFGLWGQFWIPIGVSLILIYMLSKKFYSSRSFNIILVSLLVSNLLILFTELFFFKDMFHYVNPNYFRSNTVFKLTYHSWIIMSIFTGVLVQITSTFFSEWIRSNRQETCRKFVRLVDFLFSLVVFCMLASAMVYPYFAYKAKYNPFFWPQDFKVLEDQITIKYYFNGNLVERSLSLNGLKYIRQTQEDDFNTIMWINRNQKTRTVILEANLPTYRVVPRISVFTGMGSIVNWVSHEWTWRFKYPESTNQRELLRSRDIALLEISKLTSLLEADVKTIYETNDPGVAKNLLSKYGVEYVYVGNLERQNYNVNEEKFYAIGEVVLRSGESKLFRLN